MISSLFSSNEQVTSALRRVMPDLYFINTPTPQQVRHWEIMQRLATKGINLDFHRYHGARLTELTLCTYDDNEPGLLSKVCGTLFALGIDIKTAFVYTFQADSLRQVSDELFHQIVPHRQIALNTLLLSKPYYGYERGLSERARRNVRHALSEVLKGQTDVAQLIAAERKRANPTLNIRELVVQARQDLNQTMVTLRASDSPGVLYRITSALSSLELNICVAQINTGQRAAQDIFFVTDKTGNALPLSENELLAQRLRALL